MMSAVGTNLYSGKRNYIIGCDEYGIKTLLRFVVLGIRVEGFIDPANKRNGYRLFNKQVYGVEFLESLSDYNLVFAMDDVEEQNLFLSRLQQNVLKENYYCFSKDLEYPTGRLGTKRSILYLIIRDAREKKILIFGFNNEGKELRSILSYFDVEAGFIDDHAAGTRIGKEHVLSLFEFNENYNKDEVKIIVTREYENRAYELDNLDLKKGVHYAFHRKYTSLYVDREHVLDVNLGYSFLNTNKELPGFILYGSCSDTSVVLLGNSTTDGSFYGIHPWGWYLYRLFEENNYNVQILNGGVAAYRSSQELIKLIRDVVPMRPCIVVQLTGVTDAFPSPRLEDNKNYSFINSFQTAWFSEIVYNYARFVDGRSRDIVPNLKDDFVQGVMDAKPRWNRFVDNIKIMGAICEMFNMEYYPFLQPCMLTKTRLSKFDEEYLLGTGVLSRNDIDMILDFYRHVLKSDAGLIDATYLFDGLDEVYKDFIHVKEYGNEIVAKYVFDYLLHHSHSIMKQKEMI